MRADCPQTAVEFELDAWFHSEPAEAQEEIIGIPHGTNEHPKRSNTCWVGALKDNTQAQCKGDRTYGGKKQQTQLGVLLCRYPVMFVS